MSNIVTTLKLEATNWFCSLRDKICSEFIKIEDNGYYFKQIDWNREGGGGGKISVMNGNVFEKVAVNVSTVHGKLSKKFANEIPGCEESLDFWASGISLIAHMSSPLIPAVHMNTRLIVTSKAWFGGGMDLTPIYYNKSDSDFFHSSIKKFCDKFDARYYEDFSKKADDYFYIKHRNEPRGIGGIFYDNLNSGDLYRDFEFTKEVGKSFLEIYPSIVLKHIGTKYSVEQREYQLFKRGRYVEFNLLYDRGTRFGLMTGGNIDAIMMSMPPSVKWGLF